MNKPWYQSKTVWGGIIYGVSVICKVIPPAVVAVPFLEAIAAVLGAAGVRDAISVNGQGK